MKQHGAVLNFWTRNLYGQAMACTAALCVSTLQSADLGYVNLPAPPC